jgi:class 3 adenylate cyclase
VFQIAAYQKAVAETVQRFGGFVAKYMGDSVLVYFGYPQAHEDDAERAVRAGLVLIEAVPKLATRAGSPLQARIGIATARSRTMAAAAGGSFAHCCGDHPTGWGSSTFRPVQGILEAARPTN